MKKLEKLFKVFGNVSRLKILAYLRSHPDSSVETIAEAVRCSYKATSKHLGILYGVGLVEREQARYEMLYKLSISATGPEQALMRLI